MVGRCSTRDGHPEDLVPPTCQIRDQLYVSTCIYIQHIISMKQQDHLGSLGPPIRQIQIWGLVNNNSQPLWSCQPLLYYLLTENTPLWTLLVLPASAEQNLLVLIEPTAIFPHDFLDSCPTLHSNVITHIVPAIQKCSGYWRPPNRPPPSSKLRVLITFKMNWNTYTRC